MNENYWASRWSKENLKTMLLEQFQSFWEQDTGLQRAQLAAVERAASLPHAVIISGLRRVGKSTLLAQAARKLGKDSFYYLNFEDDRFLGFQPEDATYLFQALVETFGERKNFVIDEVQNVVGWERFVRRFMEMGFKFYITGSNASLLSRELGSRLTGRYVPVELFPFSFREFLLFRGERVPPPGPKTTAENANLNRLLDVYLRSGGIPDALKYPELPLLRTLYDDVLYRDIATRYRLDAVMTLKELAFYLMSNPASMISFNRLKEQFRLGSVNTIKNYVEYMENSWLVFLLNVYDFSVKRQQIAPKKVYCIDTGLCNTVGFGFSPNSGKSLENAIFLALRRQTQDIYYYATPEGYEVDFYLPGKRQLIQVAKTLGSRATREREIRALQDAVRKLPVETALILSDSDDDSLQIGDLTVDIRSSAAWMLESDAWAG